REDGTMTALVAGRAVAGPPADSATKALPFVSVIVPVRNESAFIAQTLERLLSQDDPANRFEVLVADARWSADTAVLVQARASCRRRAWPSPIAARCSRRWVTSMNASPPARTWSSITASLVPA